jgi:hypothetical protein
MAVSRMWSRRVAVATSSWRKRVKASRKRLTMIVQCLALVARRGWGRNGAEW